MKYSLRGAIMVATFLSQSAFGWGHLGHQTVAQIGAGLTTSGNAFWSANSQNMGVLTNVPDMVWKSLPTASQEKPTHFFQPDSFISDPSQFDTFPRLWEDAVAKFTEAALNVDGTATWRAKQLYDLAVKAFRHGDFVAGLQYAGTMSHYIGDLSQPLHVAKNYDGQETGDPGIHAYFETKNIQAAGAGVIDSPVTRAAQTLLSDSSSGEVIETVFKEVDRSYSFKNELINLDLKEGRSGRGAADMLTLAENRMGDGAATLSLILSKMWVDAGSPSASSMVTINSRPDWVAPDYSATSSGHFMATMKLATDDDCF
jgi:hypothetical protein